MRTLALAAALLAATAAQAAPDPHVAKAREILARSVAIHSTQKEKGTPALAAYLTAEMRAAGVRPDQITRLPLGDTVALVVRFPGRDTGKKPILFSAHMDVVEADPRDWKRDPFTLVEEGGFLYGRGASDDKAGIAQLMTIILRLARERLTPARPLTFVFIGDEETTMQTTRLVAGPKRALIDAEYCINLDAGGGVLDDATGAPRLYRIQGAEKTYADLTMTVTNPGGHSSEPRPDNAVYRLSAALTRLQAYRFPVMANALTRSTLAAGAPTTPGPLGRAMAAFAANPVDGPAAELLSAEPSLVGQLRTTCVATMVSAGHAPNALPQRATATVNCRIFPGTSVESVRQTLARVAADPAVTVAADLATSTPEVPVSPPRADLTAALTKAARLQYPGVPVAYLQEAGATDGSFFRGAGIPTYGATLIFSRPRDELAHGLDERVPAASFDASIAGWWSVVTDLADPR